MHANDLEPLFPSLVLRGVGIPRPNRRERASIVARASIEMRHEIDHRERSLGVRDAHDGVRVSLSRSARSNASFGGRADARREMATVEMRARGVGVVARRTRRARDARRASRGGEMDEKKCVPSRRVVLERRAPGGRTARAVETSRDRDGDCAAARRSTTATLEDDETRRERRRARGMERIKIHEGRIVAPELVDGHGRAHVRKSLSPSGVTSGGGTACRRRGVELTPNDELLTTDEVERVIKIFARAGVEKVRLTGGNRRWRRDLEEGAGSTREDAGRARRVSVTTNGVALERRLEGLKASGLTRLNVSLDTLVPAKFEFMTRRRGHETAC